MSSEEGTAPEGSAAPEARRGLSWRRLAGRSAAAIPIFFILLMLLFQFLDPFLVLFIVVFGALAIGVHGGGRGPLWGLGIVAAIFIALNVPFIVPSLRAPASVIDFLLAAFLTCLAITAAVASFAALRSQEVASPAAKTFFGVMTGIAVVAVIVAVVARLSYDGGEVQEGDIELTTIDADFNPNEISGDTGSVGVFITNDDPTLHTFTIEELDVDITIPQNSTARVTFQADPGEYEFVCTPHESTGMTGTLTIE